MIVSLYEQQLVWDAILAEYRNLEKMYKSFFKRMIDSIGSAAGLLLLSPLFFCGNGYIYTTNGKPFFFN
jgi:lipopolysaccharide/colanic/teichoic acid biosynthesis glycosyltransferase